MSNDENRITIDGVDYVAVDDPDGDCKPCAFTLKDSNCMKAPAPCSKYLREDFRSVAWQPAWQYRTSYGYALWLVFWVSAGILWWLA